MADLEAELERLRARVHELEAVRHRVAHAEAMAVQLRGQAESIVESRAWRVLTRIERLWRRPSPHGGSAACGIITPDRYRQWMAHRERREIPLGTGGPRFSVVTADERTLASLRMQSYTDWEAAGSPGEAGGDYIVLPGPGDELGPDALYLLAQAVRDGADMVYCDEDVLDGRGLRTDPWFKPDWSPDLLAARNYIGQAFAVRRELAAAAPEETFERAQHIMHLPRVLYHRRGPGPEPVRPVRYPIPAGSRVELLVASRNPRLLGRCLESVRSRTAYSDYAIAIIDASGGDEVAHLAARHGARHLNWHGRPFHCAAMYNAAASSSTATMLLFLNEEIQVVDAGWLKAMVEHGARPEVGVVGARLLYPDGRIRHAGAVVGIHGAFGYAFRGCSGEKPSYGGLAETVRNVSAVSGACMLIPADVFRDGGGFDTEQFPETCHDIDLCLRLLESGRRVVYTAHAMLWWHESRSDAAQPAQVLAFQAKWRRYLDHDPFYNPNLTRRDESFRLQDLDE